MRKIGANRCVRDSSVELAKEAYSDRVAHRQGALLHARDASLRHNLAAERRDG